jgi:hypothetical protein
MNHEKREVDPISLDRATWFGQSAAVLGLTGEVTQADFNRLRKLTG